MRYGLAERWKASRSSAARSPTIARIREEGAEAGSALGANLFVRDDLGRELDARFSVERDEINRLAVVLESRSGGRPPRNPDYFRALEFILARLAALDAMLVDALVDSRDAVEKYGLSRDERRLRLERDYPIDLATVDDVEVLRRSLTGAQRTVARAPGVSGSGGNNHKRIRLVVEIRGRALDAAELGDRLVHGNGHDVGAPEYLVSVVARPGSGQAHVQDARRRQAIELRAMDLAIAHYRRKGWHVEDVSASCPYDLRCTRSGVELRVEVKGTATKGDRILLTRNEVEHARGQYPAVALVVASGIVCDDRGARGGVLDVREPWNIEDGELVAVGFSWEPAHGGDGGPGR